MEHCLVDPIKSIPAVSVLIYGRWSSDLYLEGRGAFKTVCMYTGHHPCPSHLASPGVSLSANLHLITTWRVPFES